MKKILAVFTLLVFINQLSAQTNTGRIEGLRDAWGTSYDYVGEIKNKQPNGVGIAIYSNDNTVRYSGNFSDGKYAGKGVLLFKDGTFLSGDWREGKLNGKGTYLDKDGDLYVGYFADGKKEGHGSFFYHDKSLLVGQMKNDTYEGRCIYIPAAGNTISDNIYIDGKKSGSGYQYEIDSKTLFEGTWNNGDWVSASTASYNSFLKGANFYAEKTDNQILIGGIDKSNNNVLQDTAFFYDLNKDKRTFGFCDKGFLSDGIIIKDSTRFIGKINDDGANGQCSYYKIKKFYDEGIYINDYMNGDKNLSIDLDKKTVYYGATADKGLFSGKAWFANDFNELYNGNYESGKFNGAGYIVFKNGTTVKGTFNDGKTITVTSLTDGNGVAINQKPKTLAEALSIITNQYKNNFEALKGEEANEDDYPFDDYYSASESIILFPGSVDKDVILEDYDFYLSYKASMYMGIDFSAAKKEYVDICKLLSSANLTLQYSREPVSLSGSFKEASESETTNTKYDLQNYSSLTDYHVYAQLKYDGGIYTVSIICGDADLDK